MKHITALILAIAFVGNANAQDVTVAGALETDVVETASTPGDLNSQRIRGAAALQTTCAANETYDTTLNVKEIDEACVQTAEAPSADPVDEINEVEASTEPVEDYPSKSEN